MMELMKDIFALKYPSVSDPAISSEILEISHVHQKLEASKDMQHIIAYLLQISNNRFSDLSEKIKKMKHSISPNSSKKLRNYATILILQLHCVFFITDFAKIPVECA